MSEEEIKIEPVFLDSGKLVEWDRPPRIQRKDRISLPQTMIYDASTELVSYIGFDQLDEKIGRYHLVGSAAKYLANIAPLGNRTLRDCDEKTSNTPREKILFTGSLAIYSSGNIPGTEIGGYDFVRHGRIWDARKPSEVLKSQEGLRRLVLGELTSEKELVARVDSIVRGYEDRKLAQGDAQRRRVHDAYQKGDFDRAEATFGTFGRW